jgi:hypothetical protein
MHYKESAVFSDVSDVIHCWSLVSVTKFPANVSFGRRFSSVAGVNLYLHISMLSPVPYVAEAMSCL